jgi:hypothetical protein
MEIHFSLAPANPVPSRILRTAKYPGIVIGENILASKNIFVNNAVTGLFIAK